MTGISGKKVIYFVPHQDDELLTLGIDVARSVINGDDVYVFICTDGSRSRIRTLLNDGEVCEKCHTRHTYELSVEDFIKARDREFTGSCTALGVKKENILFANERVIDGSLTEEKAKALIKGTLEKLGTDCVVKTIYPNDPSEQHPDHRRLGLAAAALKEEGVIGRLEMMEEPYVAVAVAHAPGEEPEIIYADDVIAEKIDKALGEYSLFDPSNGRYAIGFHSVTNEYNQIKSEKAVYRHIYE